MLEPSDPHKLNNEAFRQDQGNFKIAAQGIESELPAKIKVETLKFGNCLYKFCNSKLSITSWNTNNLHKFASKSRETVKSACQPKNQGNRPFRKSANRNLNFKFAKPKLSSNLQACAGVSQPGRSRHPYLSSYGNRVHHVESRFLDEHQIHRKWAKLKILRTQTHSSPGQVSNFTSKINKFSPSTAKAIARTAPTNVAPLHHPIECRMSRPPIHKEKSTIAGSRNSFLPPISPAKYAASVSPSGVANLPLSLRIPPFPFFGNLPTHTHRLPRVECFPASVSNSIGS